MFMFAPLLLALALENPPVLEGSKLPVVPGPQTPRGPDQAAGPSESSIQMEIRSRARHAATVPAVAVPTLPSVIEDRVELPSGWKAYRLDAPAGATVKARLRALHEAWFRVRIVNRWGVHEQGMLHNRIHTGNPEASFINPKQEKTTFYFIVDTTETSAETETYRLEITVK